MTKMTMTMNAALTPFDETAAASDARTRRWYRRTLVHLLQQAVEEEEDEEEDEHEGGGQDPLLDGEDRNFDGLRGQDPTVDLRAQPPTHRYSTRYGSHAYETILMDYRFISHYNSAHLVVVMPHSVIPHPSRQRPTLSIQPIEFHLV